MRHDRRRRGGGARRRRRGRRRPSASASRSRWTGAPARRSYSTHLPLAGVPFEAVMSERLGLPVAVDNDGNCAVLAEARHGAGGGAGDVVMLTLGTGIGGGLVLGGRLQRGWIGAGAELGHMVIDMDGPPCQGNCPNRGCLEVMASGSALVREASLRVAPAAGHGARPRARGGPRAHRPVRDRAGARRRPGRARRDRGGRARARRRPVLDRQHAQPGGHRDRRRRHRGGRDAARARADGDARAGAAARARRGARRRRRRSARRPG